MIREKRMKKGSFDVVTKSILILLTLGALLFLTGQFGNFFAEAGEKSVCMMSFQAASMTKTGVTEGTKLDCDINKINLTLNDLIKKRDSVEKYINNYNGEPFLYKAQDQSNSEDHTLEYALDKVIADEMISAWQTAGAGRLDLFENFWNPIKDKDSWDTKTNCVIFARIRFDEALEENLRERLKTNEIEIRSLNEWLKKNTVPWNKAVTQYDYLADDGQKMLYGLQYKYKVDSQDPLTIVFMRINMIGGDVGQKYMSAIFTSAATGAVGGAWGGPFGAVLLGGVGLVGGAINAKDNTDFPKAKSYILLIPSSKVISYCSDIKN